MGRKPSIRNYGIHIEEVRAAPGNESLVDYNRGGVPLMEIVTEPDFSGERR